jgi:hypothetical protein
VKVKKRNLAIALAAVIVIVGCAVALVYFWVLASAVPPHHGPGKHQQGRAILRRASAWLVQAPPVHRRCRRASGPKKCNLDRGRALKVALPGSLGEPVLHLSLTAWPLAHCQAGYNQAAITMKATHNVAQISLSPLTSLKDNVSEGADRSYQLDLRAEAQRLSRDLVCRPRAGLVSPSGMVETPRLTAMSVHSASRTLQSSSRRQWRSSCE